MNVCPVCGKEKQQDSALCNNCWEIEHRLREYPGAWDVVVEFIKQPQARRSNLIQQTPRRAREGGVMRDPLKKDVELVRGMQRRNQFNGTESEKCVADAMRRVLINKLYSMPAEKVLAMASNEDFETLTSIAMESYPTTPELEDAINTSLHRMRNMRIQG